MGGKQDEAQRILSLLGMPALREKFYFDPERPMGMVIGDHNLSIVSVADKVLIALDGGEDISFYKRDLMTCEHICGDAQFYLENGDLE